MALLSLHYAVLGPLSSSQPAAFCFSFPHPPVPFPRYLSVPRSLLASDFARRHLAKYFTLSDGWYLDSCWSGCEVAHPPSQLTGAPQITSHRLGPLSGRFVLRGVRPNSINFAIYAYIPSLLAKYVVARANTKRKDQIRPCLVAELDKQKGPVMLRRNALEMATACALRALLRRLYQPKPKTSTRCTFIIARFCFR